MLTRPFRCGPSFIERIIEFVMLLFRLSNKATSSDTSMCFEERGSLAMEIFMIANCFR